MKKDLKNMNFLDILMNQFIDNTKLRLGTILRPSAFKKETREIRKVLEIIPTKNGITIKGDKDKIAQIKKTLKKISIEEEWKPIKKK